nr:hypothetical protein B0A51_07912 [Rachicladosporium sp. CCFEE 5018]
MSSFLLKSTEMHNHPMGPCADTLGLEVMADLVESSPPDGPEKTLPLSADNDCVTALLAGATNSVEEDTSLACTSAGLPTDMALSAYNTTIELRHNSTQRSEDQTDSTDTSSIRTGLPSLCSLSTSSEDAISEESLVSVDDGTATQSPADNAFVNKEDAGSVMIASAGATLDNVLSVPAEAVDVRSAAQTPHGPMDAIDALSIRTDRLSLSSCLAPSSRRTLGSSTRSIISQWSATMAGPMATDVDVELLNARGGIMTELRQRMSKLGPLLNTKRRLRDEMLACILDGRASKLGDILATGRYSVHDPVSMELRERYLGAQTALELASWLGNPEVHSLLETCGYVDGATLRHVREFPIAAIIPAQKLREDMFVCVQESKVDRLADILALNKCNLNGPLNEHLQQEYGSSWTALDLALLLGDPAVVGLIVHGGYNGNVSPHALQRIVEFTEASRTEMQHLYRQKLRGEMFACVVGERTARLEEILATGECDVNSSLSDDLQRSYPGAHTVLDIAIYLGNSAAAGALMARDELSVLCLERAGLLRESRLEDSVITCHLHMLECLFHANFEKLGISERGRLALFTSALTHHSTTVSKLLRQHLRPKPIATEASHRLFATKLKDAYLQKDALRLEALITLSDATDWWRWTAVTNMLTELFRYKNLPFDGFYNITAILRHDPTIRRRMSDILTAQLRRHMASNDAAAVTYTFAISDAIEWDDVTPANCALVEEIFAAQTKVTSALRLPHARSHDAGRAWGHLTDHKRREIRTTYSLAWKQFGMMYVLQHVSETDPSHSLFDLGVEMAIASADMVLARSIPRQHKEDAVIGPRLRDVFMEAMAKHVGQANREQLRHLMKHLT